MAQQSEHIKMNTSAVVISVLGCVSGLVTCL
ncbi:Protein CBG26936 [Caenorhabditis briggsae]|uniref:Protein CBG26936 n=1 Tax=Caenorhabditis briggsae TaxID=6238 RepID=B6ILZ2_CAEBR|nr:Protein CBG26936 [Caenorhabditis briggsae]CAS00922.1 Protein CBG26936 [Caenorhabditis briggsae]